MLKKIVKAKILELGGDFEFVHDIVVLLADFVKTPQISQARKFAQILNTYAIKTRYPTDVPFEADEFDAEEAYRMSISFPDLLEGSRLKTQISR